LVIRPGQRRLREMMDRNEGGGEPPRAGGRGGLVITAIIAAVIGGAIVLALFPISFGVSPLDVARRKTLKVETREETPTTRNVTRVPGSAATGMDVAAIAKKVMPSIVNIDTRVQVQGFQGTNSAVQQGTGSGVIYSSTGYIITNNHVISGAQSITVTLADGEQTKGRIVGTDPANDIAVVKISKTGLPAITLGDSGTLVVGQMVVALGSPFGFEQTVTSGIVSALNRSIQAQQPSGQTVTLNGLIQTDAPINPGNSGGALCDSSADLIGINTLIASSSGGSSGVSFAIPVNTAKASADSIIAGHPAF
jgi:S1-C subfamily serine protease